MRYSLLFLVCAFVLALATTALAQSDQNSMNNRSSQSSDRETATGVVVSSDSHSLVITADDGRQLTFAIDDQSNGASSLSAGQRVTVQYDNQGGGVMHADDVNKESSGSTSNTAPSDQTNGSNSVSQGYGNTPMSQTNANQSQSSATSDTNAAAGTSGAARMPATASPLPLIGLVGLTAVGLGLGLRGLTRS